MLGLKYEKHAYQILTRKSNAGYICYNGEEYMGRHEPIVPLEVFEEAMECLRSRSDKKLYTSEYLLTGLLYCGGCGARMRYQKWGKAGVKIVCYSQDKSKTHLIRDPDCNGERVWSDELEAVVLNDLFRFYVEKQAETPALAKQGVIDILNGHHAAMSAKIKRLYTLYAASEDRLLLETIEEHQAELAGIMKQISAEKERDTVSGKIITLKTEIGSISDVWDVLTHTERQEIVRTLIDRIVVTGGGARIEYVF
jgi:site-specific DNA recombinase